MDTDATPGLSPAVLRVLVANRDRFLAFLERRVRQRDAGRGDPAGRVRARDRARAVLREDESAVAWFYRLLRNAIIDHQRGRSAEARGLAALGRETVAQEAAGEPDQELIDTICACVSSLVGTLKPEYAAAIARVELRVSLYRLSRPPRGSAAATPPCACSAPGRPCASGSGSAAAPARRTAATSASAATSRTRADRLPRTGESRVQRKSAVRGARDHRVAGPRRAGQKLGCGRRVLAVEIVEVLREPGIEDRGLVPDVEGR